ncbi:hypothetical protein BaRGS_00037902 [Batillaria attramentaria]|uniref:Uncharacterized protein n=1 Tax=Batillaria attramentaria TaxID=370345 RepID=A0ABD0J8E5_9CAEN
MFNLYKSFQELVTVNRCKLATLVVLMAKPTPVSTKKSRERLALRGCGLTSMRPFLPPLLSTLLFDYAIITNVNVFNDNSVVQRDVTLTRGSAK